MADSQCPTDWIIITSQADIDNGTLSSCTGPDDLPIVAIHNATGELNFTRLEKARQLDVYSPGLSRLNFPLAKSILTINLNDISVGPVIDSPSLDGFQTVNANACPDFENVPEVGFLSVAAPSTCYLVMINLGSAGDLTLRNVALLDTAYNDLSMMGSLEFYGGSPFLNSSYIGIPFLTAVGSDANIGSNSNGHLSFGSLANVPGSLFVTNNTNCTMDFDRLTNVGNLSIVDNDSSTVPILSALETANNIHLRGYIDSSAGFNIFPALQLAKGTVTIEASKGFNCSKLVFQQRGGIIHNLICNGTDNGTTITRPVQPGPTIVSNTTDTAATSPSTLTAGAWAGIGVGIGIVVLGGVAGAIWFILHVKRKYKDLIKRLNSPTQNPDSANDVPPPNLEGLHETEGQGIRREASDSQVYEMHVQPTEKPDDHIRELPSLPPELAGDPLWSVGLAETTDLPQIQSQQRARSPYI